jgi:hypothetical protein
MGHAAFDLAHDPTFYPVDDGMGEHTLETYIRILLLPLIDRYLAALGTPMFVGGNQFIYWVPGDARTCVAPDLYVIPALPQGATPSSIKTWETTPPSTPSFALEVVSGNKGKDYEVSPERYRDLGVKELIIHDPDFRIRRGKGARFQVYRWVKRKFTLVEATNADRVSSKALGCWLREVSHHGSLRLRLGVSAGGEALFPTTEEALEQALRTAEMGELIARQAKEEAVVAKEEAVAAKEEAVAAKEEAEARAKAAVAAVEAAERRIKELEAALRKK